MENKVVVVASDSPLKLSAVMGAFQQAHINVTLRATKAASGINEQPIGYEETRLGAENRAKQAAEKFPEADSVISIESGLFPQGEQWYDRAVVVIRQKDGSTISKVSEAVLFPAASVELAQERGFETTTAGQVLKDYGIITHANDPHLTLVGRSRARFIQETLYRMLKKIAQPTQQSAPECGIYEV